MLREAKGSAAIRSSAGTATLQAMRAATLTEVASSDGGREALEAARPAVQPKDALGGAGSVPPAAAPQVK
ncbi:hypothetical protein MNEG_0875 [Monoraphidium neglectum]|uniref:Uncharacterized protein n=1 Tax=Monoraphidium neglectum TaxID=145388 RepID=A0A0D2NS31_9CHLO|nr:hypothetical protein MNEG_0875 [Monoraphidium neglectum]KIZ07086.1 hypothetical protein MNEG_0875 [Monoraphidium neglectum]|eukprot:XP_013906105.1 hypothetical protein MNEG_0875 [Monoraphidium neglectum]